MATTNEDNVFPSEAVEANAIPPDPPPDPDPPDDKHNSLTTSGLKKKMEKDLSKKKPLALNNANKTDISNLRILHIEGISIKADYENIADALGTYGSILEIRMSLMEDEEEWEAWVTYDQHKVAMEAS